MAQEQRHGSRSHPRLMDVVQGNVIQLHAVLGKTVEETLVHTPVVLVLPVMYQLFDIGQVRAILPACCGDFVRPARQRQALLQIVEHSIGYGNDKRLWSGCHAPFPSSTSTADTSARSSGLRRSRSSKIFSSASMARLKSG